MEKIDYLKFPGCSSCVTARIHETIFLKIRTLFLSSIVIFEIQTILKSFNANRIKFNNLKNKS